ncbi:glutamine synthetase family protein [Streptomyces sp. NPDC001815]|uniref:glutamine synthetase family protein n=1 Tax=Streptomyces sp. NPDC001815 TaxID=3154526 RepID=UPI0033273CD1
MSRQSLQAGCLSVEDLRTAVQAGDITTVLLAVPNMAGQLKGKRLDASEFLDRIESGAEMCAYVLATDIDMAPLEGYALTGWEQGFGDFGVIPDLTAIRRLPHLPRTVLIHADAAHHSGSLVEVAPRQMLRTQLDRLAGLGWEAQVGLESEFVLYQGTARAAHAARYRGLEPVALHNLDYALDHPPELSEFFQDLEDTLRAAGTPVEAVKTEGATGQMEVTFPYGPALAACDGYTVYQHAVRHLAERRGMTPTFMAVPQDGVGSGLHLHLSLWTDEGNAFAVPPGEELPGLLRQSISGLLAGLPYLAPLYAPFPNSYRRYRPHSFAPTHFTWARDHRGVAIRVTGHGEGAHLEIRLPGADVNPYLALAATLAATANGLESGSGHLAPPCAGDAYAEDQNHQARLVPGTLDEALEDFARSGIARNAFGETVTRHYSHAARIEIAAHQARVTDTELERGFLRA